MGSLPLTHEYHSSLYKRQIKVIKDYNIKDFENIDEDILQVSQWKRDFSIDW